MSSRTITKQEEIEDICNLYINYRWNLKLLAEKYHTTPYVIKNLLVFNNIEIRNHKARRKGIFLKDDFFSIIDSEEKAYFLGLLFTDGNVFINKKNEAQISLEIHARDKEILDKFKELLISDAKISYRKRKNTEMVCFRIFSNKMASDLALYGIVPNKTKITKHLPENIPDNFKKDFLRGLIDGDGCIYKSNLKYWHLSFCSYNFSICQEMQEWLDIYLKESNNTKILKDKNKEFYRIHYNNQEKVKQLVTVLYKDSKYYLTRKYILAKNIFESKSEEDIVCYNNQISNNHL